jgi:hypothetical protein
LSLTPTVLRVDGMAPHVVLRRAGQHPRLLENRRMKPAVLAKALEAVYEHQALPMRKWSDIHG